MSWKTVALGEVANVGAGNSAPQDEKLFVNGTHNFYRTSDVGRIRYGVISDALDKLNFEGVKGLRLHPKGTILFPKSGASTFLNHRVMLEKEGYVSSHLATIKAIPEKANDKFLLYFLSTVDAKNLVQDSNYPSLKTSVIEKVNIQLPSFSIQQKIVSKLDAIFAEIDKATAAAEANAKNAESLFQSYLTNIFENNASITKKLKECCLIKPPKKEVRTLYDSDMVSFMPMEALGINHKFAIPNQERKLSDVSGSYTYFAEGDVLLAKITPCFENGKLGIAKDLTNRIGFGSSEYIVFRPKHDVDSSWLYYFLNRSVFRENGAKHMSGAVGHKRVTKEFIEDSLLPVPSIDKQKLLVADIDNVLIFTKSLLSSSKNKVHELSILKKSILSKAFNGELVQE